MSKENEKQLALIKPSELTKVENNALNGFQVQMLLKRTPQHFVKERPAKGGGKWKFVSAGYVKKCLNIMFGWDWDFEVISEQILFNQVLVKGKLTCRTNGKEIVKMQFGKKEIVYKKGTQDPLDIGNDFKAASSDALKKCAAELGIAADIYNADEFKEVNLDLSEEKTLEERKFESEKQRLKDAITNGYEPTQEERDKYGV